MIIRVVFTAKLFSFNRTIYTPFASKLKFTFVFVSVIFCFSINCPRLLYNSTTELSVIDEIEMAKIPLLGLG